MNHSFLFQEWTWTAQGGYYDSAGNLFPCEGESIITHESDCWKNQGFIRIMADSVIEYKNGYRIIPIESGGEITTWRSLNPDLDVLTGTLVIVDRTIISNWKSEDQVFWGTEFLVMVNRNVYRNWGHACRQMEKLSSWAMTLTKK